MNNKTVGHKWDAENRKAEKWQVQLEAINTGNEMRCTHGVNAQLKMCNMCALGDLM